MGFCCRSRLSRSLLPAAQGTWSTRAGPTGSCSSGAWRPVPDQPARPGQGPHDAVVVGCWCCMGAAWLRLTRKMTRKMQWGCRMEGNETEPVQRWSNTEPDRDETEPSGATRVVHAGWRGCKMKGVFQQPSGATRVVHRVWSNSRVTRCARHRTRSECSCSNSMR